MAGGLILGYQKSAPSHSLSGDKWRCLNTTSERPIPGPQQAQAKQRAATPPAVEAGLSSAAAGGSGLALFERSEFEPDPADCEQRKAPRSGPDVGSPFGVSHNFASEVSAPPLRELWLLAFGEAKESNSPAGARPGLPA